MGKKSFFQLTFWKAVGAIIFIVGAVSLFKRFYYGLGATTHLQDAVPWGLWIGFDFLGVGLAAAGFTVACTAHIFNNHKYEPIVRPAILTAFIGYMLVIALLVVDLGRPQSFYHPLYMWNIHSVMFEITWCVICYSTILSLEFAPVVLEKFKLKAPIKLLKKISIPVVILGVLFSTLHQSSFGSLYLIVPGRLHELWYSSLLPLNFFISCIAAGISMIIFESYLNARAFNQGLKMNLLSSLSKIVLWVLIIYFGVRMTDMVISGRIKAVLVPGSELYMFILELVIGVFIPVGMLSFKKIRESRLWLYIASIFVICGFVINRMNVAMTGLARSSGAKYFPSFDEIAITLFLVVCGMWAFSLVVKNFKVFDTEQVEEKETYEVPVVENSL